MAYTHISYEELNALTIENTGKVHRPMMYQ